MAKINVPYIKKNTYLFTERYPKLNGSASSS